MGKKSARVRQRRTNSLRAHRVSLVVASMAALAGVAAIVVGVIAWTMDRPQPQQLVDSTSTTIGASPWFDAGTTIFVARPEGQPVRTPAALGCTVYTPGEPDRPLRTAADPDVLGTRVVAEVSLLPVVTIGPTGPTERVMCNGGGMREAIVWLLPTTPGPSKTPLSIVVAGIALLGLAVLIDPRARGIRGGLT
ncbi:MAG: hypothetical protein IPM00_16370 [Tetrasphaera sp.]|nr:hypothetical protein [Tetrasphaera sp.]